MNPDVFTLQKNNDGYHELLRNGKPQICPYRNPIPIPVRKSGIMNGGNEMQINLIYPVCSTQCPQLSFGHFLDQDNVQLSCTGFQLKVTGL